MNTFLKLSTTSLILLYTSFTFASDNNKRPDHFKGLQPTSINEAQQTLTDYHKKLAQLTEKPHLALEDLGDIHIMTYTLENQLAYLMKDLKQTAAALEKLHQLSETTETEKARAQAIIYLKRGSAWGQAF